jgi:ABC-type uncharacterized transport system substrate-binding protein
VVWCGTPAPLSRIVSQCTTTVQYINYYYNPSEASAIEPSVTEARTAAELFNSTLIDFANLKMITTADAWAAVLDTITNVLFLTDAAEAAMMDRVAEEVCVCAHKYI